MRFLIGLLLIGAAASSDLIYKSGHEYQFDYEGKILSGIPELGSQYAGLTIKGKVILQSQDGVHFKMGMKNPQYVDYNDVLSKGQALENWRTVQTPPTQQVPRPQQEILETPIEFTMNNDGQVSEIKVSGNEPLWSTNFKKALIAIVKVQLNDKGIQGESPIKQAIIQGSSTQSWKVMEQDLIGTCESDYLYNEVQKLSLSKKEQQLLQDVQCQSGRLFNIVRSKSITRCVQRSAYMVNQPGYYQCPQGNCPPMWGRSSITKYIGCKESARDLQIKLILNEGEIHQNLFGHQEERATSGVLQSLVVTQVNTQMTNLPEVQNPTMFNELFYEHTKTLSMIRQRSLRPKTLQEQQQQLQTGESDPRKQRFAFTLLEGVTKVEEKLNFENIKNNILQMAQTVVEDLAQPDDFQKSKTTSKILSLTDMITLLTTNEIESLWTSLESMNLSQEKKQSVKDIVWELVVMSGTNPSIMFILDSFQKDQLNDWQIVEAISSLPLYIRTPTKNILQELFKFIQSPSVSRTNYIKYHANMAFATIVKETCINSQGSYRFGESAFGEFCSNKDTVLRTEYIPYFAQQLKLANSEEEIKNALFTLGLVAHDDILPIIMPYVEGTTSESTPEQQRVAIYALNLLGQRNKKQILPILSAIINNRYQERSLRIAALTIALDLRPDFTFFQRLATLTWNEEDDQFQKYVFAVMKNLERISENSELKDPSLVKISQYAQTVISLAKPLPSPISSRLNHFISDWLKQVDVAYEFYSSVSSSSSVSSLYVKMEYFLQKLRFTPIELAVDVRGLDNIWDIVKADLISDNLHSSTHSELSNILQQIQMLPYADSTFSMLVWTRLFGNMNFATSVSIDKIHELTTFIKEIISNPNGWDYKTKVNFVKLNNWARYQLLVPSDMGLPIITEVHMPTLAKVTGNLEIDYTHQLCTITADVNAKSASSYLGHVSTFSPFTLNLLSVGIDKQLTMNMPTKLTTSHEIGDKFKIYFAQSDIVKSGSSNVDLLHLSVKPFTVEKPVSFLDPTPLNAHQNVKYIHSGVDPRSAQVKVGQALGLDLSLKVKSESDTLDMQSLREYFQLYKNNPLYMFMFSFTHTGIKSDGKPTTRYHDVTLVLNPSGSTTNEVDFDLFVAMGSKKNDKKQHIKLFLNKDSKISLEHTPISSSSPKHQKLEAALEKLQVEEGYAVSTDLKIELKGADTKSIHYVISAGQGRQQEERKWNVDIINQNNPVSKANLCVEGKIVSPRISWKSVDKNENAEFSFYNKAGFGQNCEENQITITGSNSVSQQQMNNSQSSKDRQKCREALKVLEKLQKQIKQARDEKNWKQLEHLEEEERRQVRKDNLYCGNFRKLSSTLDKLKFKIQYNNLTSQAQKVVQYIDEITEASMLTYLSDVTVQNNQPSVIDVEIQFQDSPKTMHVKVNAPQRTVKYTHVPIPCQLKAIVPFNARYSPVKAIYKELTGNDFYPKCNLKQDIVTTFSNQSYAYHMDDCYHVAISECSSKPTHAVLVKNKQGQKQVKLYVQDMSIEIQPQTSGSQKEYRVTVDGQEQPIQRNEKKEISSRSGKVSVQIQKTQDDLLIVDTPYTNVIADGKSVEILRKDVLSSSKHCGLCGNHDNRIYGKLKDAKQCVTKTERAAALSFRVQQSCSDLSEYHKRIQATEQTCAKVQGQKIYLTSMLPKSSQQCSQSKHSIVVRGNEHCISQDPILECGAGCAPRSEITKRVGYACLPTDRPRLAELYQEKVRNGEFLPELKSMTTRFSVEKTMPLSCAQINI